MVNRPRAQSEFLQQVLEHGGEPKAEGVENPRPSRKEQAKQV